MVGQRDGGTVGLRSHPSPLLLALLPGGRFNCRSPGRSAPSASALACDDPIGWLACAMVMCEPRCICRLGDWFWSCIIIASPLMRGVWGAGCWAWLARFARAEAEVEDEEGRDQRCSTLLILHVELKPWGTGPRGCKVRAC